MQKHNLQKQSFRIVVEYQCKYQCEYKTQSEYQYLFLYQYICAFIATWEFYFVMFCRSISFFFQKHLFFHNFFFQKHLFFHQLFFHKHFFMLYRYKSLECLPSIQCYSGFRERKLNDGQTVTSNCSPGSGWLPLLAQYICLALTTFVCVFINLT